MFFRWLHKSWKYFWGIVLSILLVILIVVGSIFGLLQLDATQDYLADRIEQQVSKTYKANLSIGDVDGFLPFRLSLDNVVLTTEDLVAADTLASIRNINTNIDIWGLLQNKISISGFTMDHPRIWLKTNERGKIVFLEKRPSASDSTQKKTQDSWLSTVEAVAQTIEISEGVVYFHPRPPQKELAISDINARFFVDWGQKQRYLDIESFSGHSDGLSFRNFTFSGQVYSDQQSLEFNSFYATLGNSQFILNGSVDGINIFEPKFTSQLMAARYNLGIESQGFYPRDFWGDSEFEGPFTLDVKTRGTTDSLLVDQAAVGLRNSYVNFKGSFQHLRQKDAFAYEVRLDKMNLQKQDLQQLLGHLNAPQFQALENLQVSGKANGSADSINVDLDFKSPLGELAMQGRSQIVEPYKYVATMTGKQLDVSPMAPAHLDTTSLNFDARLDGFGFTLKEAVSQFRATFSKSTVNSVAFDELKINSSLANGFWKQDYEYHNGDEAINGSGWVDFSRDEPPVSMQGNANNINLANFFGSSNVVSSKLNFDYNVEIQGLDPDRIQGRANLDVKPSIIGGDSVRAHQIYMDLNSPDQQTRSFRLTSSLFDMNVRGHIVPSDIIAQGKFWTAYLKNRFKAEILMEAPVDSQMTSISLPENNVSLDGEIKAKDLNLVRHYVPDFPDIKTDSKLTFNANTDGTRLLLSAEMQADSIQYDDLNFSNSRTQFTASFRSDQNLKDFATVDLQANIGALKTDKVDLDSVGIDLAVKKDSVHLTQHVRRISNNARFRMELNSSLADSAIAVTVEDFFVGNNEYAWTNQQKPALTYMRDGRVAFKQFSFKNQNEYFQLQGTLSKDRRDSLTYILRDINLSRVSDLIKGKVDFGGVLNGTLVTRSLTRQPTIQGALTVNRFALNDRMVGDVRFNSEYNPKKDHFDTQIDIVTDSTKYQQYLDSNDDVGQNIRLDGYFETPDPEAKQDSVFYFDADFKQIDMWVIPLIVDNVFQEMEGQATGKGYITGNLEDFDFHADFQTQNVFAKPRFVNANYFVNGHVGLDRHKGVTLDSLQVMDTKGGTGRVWGTIDLNDFKPITYLDLTMDMNKLQFMNNEMDPDVPFYGSVSGSGIVRLTGSNTDLYMRTPDPIQLTRDSDVSIPLLEETELNETGRFIQFVESFDERKKKSATGVESKVDRKNMDEDQLQEAIRSMTFSERFDLDLQFEASNNINVHLIFDPVTGEVLTAQGTGQLRITMQDQDVQMFGRYNINGGTYQFVTGEIISRKLDLEPGGSIVWEGPPDNARLDISAVYHARPNISTLTSEASVNNQNGGGQQAPIDLIVEINGTINSVENNYYFQLPSSLDLSSSSTLSYTINQINRDEQEKLLQATSILLTGQFIPTQGANGTASLSQSLTKGSTVLNPLLSNQVISPLLSNQINALLNSDVSRLDVDFNLNAYNEVDLGIALRLYNDRLILRREGQITGGGAQTTLGERIGDVNATYRIQRGLSLTAFHRQDRVLSSLSGRSPGAGDVTPTVDGIGLEAQVHFNTWHELMERVKGTFNSIFGIKKKDKDKKSDSDKELTKQKAKEEK